MAAANRRLAQWRVTWLIEHSTSINFCGVLIVLCSEIRHCAKRQNVVRHTEKAYAQTAHLVFADTKARPEKTKRAVFLPTLD